METAMSTELAVLEAEALKLSPEDRVLLADHVLASLRKQDEVEEAWSVEVDRRLAEVEAGDVSLIPIEQAIQRARQALS
jgi:putative addiction module component (TIGR02574 family)